MPNNAKRVQDDLSGTHVAPLQVSAPFGTAPGARTGPNSRRTTLRRATAAILSLVMSAPMAGGENGIFAVPAAMNGESEWVCQADSDRRHGWHMRCENLTDALAGDPVPYTTDDAQSRLIPLYGAPYAGSNLTQLASAVLCGGEPRCRILMATH